MTNHEHGAMPELLPCPFCNGEASASGVIRYHDKHEAWFADGTRVTQAFYCNCMACGISNRGLVGHQTRTKAVAAWNRRAAIQQAAGAVPEGWISVLDRLPDTWAEVDDSPCVLNGKPIETMYTGIEVLVSLSGNGVRLDRLVQLGESGKPWWSKYGERVTHWQPKPEPAKRAEK